MDFIVLTRYLIQDFQFLDAFVILLASVIANARNLEDRIPGCQFLAVITGAENTYFDRSLRKLLGDSHENVMKDMPTHACTSNFIKLMLDVSRHGTLGCVCTS
jgi:thiaminase/transcriptional activator TenA